MQKINNGTKTRTAQVTKRDEDGITDRIAGSLGNATDSSAKVGDYSIRVSRKTGKGSNLCASRVTGGILRQLIAEIDDQLAYHKNQINTLGTRVEEYRKLLEDLEAFCQED